MKARKMDILKKAVAVMAAASIALTSVCLLHGNTVKADEVFETANEAVSHMNAGWNLGNTFDSYGTWINGNDPNSYETAWGNVTTTKAIIDSIKAQGFNSLRLPVTWAQHIDSNGNIDEAWLNRVKEVVDYAYANDMYVILNVHHDTGENGSDKVCWIMSEQDNFSSNKDKFYKLWTNIANAFEGYDDHLLFEGYNEILDRDNTWNAPNSEDSYQATNDYAQTFVDAVRATGGNNANRNLIVNTYVASFDPQVLSHFVVPTDTTSNHMICEVHCYSPWGFTGTNENVNWTTVHDDFTDSDKTEIDGIMTALDNYSKQINMPVIIGEYGAQYKNNDDQIANYVGYFVSAAAAKNIKCFYWDNGQMEYGGYAIFDRANLTWKTSIVNSIISSAVSVPDDNNEDVTPTSAPTATPTPEPTESVATETSDTTTTITEETSASVSESEESATTDTPVIETEAAIEEADSSASSSDSNNVAFIIVGVVIAVAVLYTVLYVAGHAKAKKKNR